MTRVQSIVIDLWKRIQPDIISILPPTCRAIHNQLKTQSVLLIIAASLGGWAPLQLNAQLNSGGIVGTVKD